MLEYKKHDFHENLNINEENPNSLHYRNELINILNDINQITIRIANRHLESAKSIIKIVDKIQELLQNNTDKEELEILLIQAQVQIQHCGNLFGGHETSASHFCSYLINKIDEFLQP